MTLSIDALNRIRKLPAVAALLDQAAGPVYLVGGAIRDLLLGRDVHDLDIVLEDNYEETAAKTAAALKTRVVPLGRKPLQILRVPIEGLFLDLCPFQGPDLMHDLTRRDLTINALAWPLAGTDRPDRIVDPTGGLRDLEERRARFVSEKNVLDDPLRLLRLFRFSACLNLSPASESLDLVKKHAALIGAAAGERIGDELKQLLAAPHSAATVKEMLAAGLLFALIPELEATQGCLQGAYHHLDVLSHTMEALSAMEELIEAPEKQLPGYAGEIRVYLDENNRRPLLKLAMLLHDIGKPETRTLDDSNGIHFFGHAELGADMARVVAGRLRMSVADTEFLQLVIGLHLRPFLLRDAHLKGALSPKGMYRFIQKAGPELWGILLHALADDAASQGPAQREKTGPDSVAGFVQLLVETAAQQARNLKQAPKLISGNDLMAEFGLAPSPAMGRLIKAVREAQAVGQLATRDQALALCKQLLVEA